MTIPHLRSAILWLAVFVWMYHFIGAVRTFRPPKSQPPSALVHVFGISTAILIYMAFRSPLDARLVIPGVLCLLGSLALFDWARRSVRGRFFSYIYSGDTPEFLWTSGPYRYVRNPFYSSYMLSYIGIAIMFHGLVIFAVVIGMIVYFSVAARFEEAKFKSSPLAADYEGFLRRTGRFVPRFRK